MRSVQSPPVSAPTVHGFSCPTLAPGEALPQPDRPFSSLCLQPALSELLRRQVKTMLSESASAVATELLLRSVCQALCHCSCLTLSEEGVYILSRCRRWGQGGDV